MLDREIGWKDGIAYVEGFSFAVEEHVCWPLATACSPVGGVLTKADHAEGGRGASDSIRERHLDWKGEEVEMECECGSRGAPSVMAARKLR